MPVIEAKPGGVEQRLGQRRHILEAEIEALSGQRLDGVRRIADKRDRSLT